MRKCITPSSLPSSGINSTTPFISRIYPSIYSSRGRSRCQSALNSLLAGFSILPLEFSRRKSLILTYDNFVATRCGVVCNTMSRSNHVSRWNERASANMIELSSYSHSQWYLPWPWVRYCVRSANHTRGDRTFATFRLKKKHKQTVNIYFHVWKEHRQSFATQSHGNENNWDDTLFTRFFF